MKTEFARPVRPPRERLANDLADVVRDPILAGIYVVPFAHVDPYELMRILLSALDSQRLKRSARGIHLTLDESTRLLSAEHTLPLRWTEDARRFVANRIRTREHFNTVWAEVKALREVGLQQARLMLGERPDLSVLDAHQVVNVAAMTLACSPGLCLFDEQGAGKTVSMIFAFDELVRRDEADFMLIAAPKSMLGEWPKDFDRFTRDTYRVKAVSGSHAEKLAAVSDKNDVLVANFETIVNLEADLEARIKKYHGRCVIAVDESFFIKSPDARRTMALRRLREWADRGFVLCGTPAPNAPSDVVEQFSFADFGTAFSGVEIPKDRGAAQPVVQEIVDTRGLYLRNLKSHVLPDLPSKTFTKILIDLEPVQLVLYQRALSALVKDLQVTSDEQFRRNITNFLAQRAALLQLCSNPGGVAEHYAETPAKIKALDEIINRVVINKNEKIVVWSFYTGSVDRIVDRYKDLGAVRYDGTVTSVEQRRDAVTRFQTDDQTMILVANPAAAGAGLTLHRARYAVYESMSNQAAHYLQSLDRIHRRGQISAVEYFVLLCRDTIEEQEYERLLRKETAAQELLGDDTPAPMERTAFLTEALLLLGRVNCA